MTQATYIGKIDENLYGVPLCYQHCDTFKVNQFVLYLIQNKEELASLFVSDVSKEFAELFLETLNDLDEFEVMSYHNVQLLDTSSFDFENLKLEIYNAGVGLINDEFELFFRCPFEIDLRHQSELIDMNRIENYQGQIVSISFAQDFPLLFETTTQRESNQVYFKQLLEPLFEVLGLSMRSSLKEIEARFGISN
jgi:hypothetical protein